MMRRRYNRELFANRTKLIREKIPLAGIGADLISGFPGESEKDFEDTYNFINDLPVTYLHVFSFSERPGTPASEMPGKVPFKVRESRTRSLITLSDIKHNEFCLMNTGQKSRVLFEHTNDNGFITGFTGNYIRTELKWDKNLGGRITDVRLTGIASSGRMTAELI
jgi:threonylcarbamoyladenosine tRNA methylthiotransferase MtaB